MIIRCWGARGSIPVSGKEYVKYGGDTACIEIRSKEDDVIIVDAGNGIRRLGNKLIQEGKNKCDLIFTHAHWDHILGFPFFKPIYQSDFRIDMLGCEHAQSSIKDVISTIMKPPYFPVKYGDMNADIIYHGHCTCKFSIGSLEIHPITLSHPNEGLGYKFVEDGKSFIYLTDNELTYRHEGGLDYKDYLEFSKGADLLMHDAEYTEKEYESTKTWGHSVYTDALRLALEAGVGKFGLFHLNQERNDADVDEMVKDCRKIIDESGASLECFAACQGMEIKI